MQLIPVLDLLNARVVRGIAGRRDEYRPIESRLTGSSEPLAVAGAIHAHFGCRRLYVADLDAIAGREPNLLHYRLLVAAGFELLVDPGVRSAADVGRVLEAGASGVVAGLETLAGPEQLAECCRQYERRRMLFSLDLHAGRPLTHSTLWGTQPLHIAHTAVDCGVESLIVLDLAGVGVARGVPTLALCREIRQAHRHLELVTGGGVRDAADLASLRDAGVDGVLVASALHDGRLTANDFQPT